MKLTKPALIKAVEPYIKKRYGEIVIERENVEKLQEVLTQTFDNIGFEVRDGARSEKLVILSLSKGGIRQFLDIPIVASELYSDTPWNVEEVVQQLIQLSNQFGYEVFRDNRRAAALIGDVLVKYSNECKVMKLLFREGLGDALGPIPYKNDRDLQNASYRVEMLMQSLGMGQNTIANVKTVIRRVFVSHSKFSEQKEKGSRIQSSDFEAVQGKIPQPRPRTQKPAERARAGRVYTVGSTDNGHAELGVIDVISAPGRGFIETSLEHNQNQINHVLSDMRENRFYGFHPQQVLGTNFQISCRAIAKRQNMACSALPILIAICSALKDKPVADDLVVLGDIYRSGSMITPAQWKEILTSCSENGKKKILVPFLATKSLASVPQSLMVGFEFVQYFDVKEALRITLEIK